MSAVGDMRSAVCSSRSRRSSTARTARLNCDAISFAVGNFSHEDLLVDGRFRKEDFAAARDGLHQNVVNVFDAQINDRSMPGRNVDIALGERSAGAVLPLLKGKIGHSAFVDFNDVAKFYIEHSAIEAHRSCQIGNWNFNMGNQVHTQLFPITALLMTLCGRGVLVRLGPFAHT